MKGILHRSVPMSVTAKNCLSTAALHATCAPAPASSVRRVWCFYLLVLVNTLTRMAAWRASTQTPVRFHLMRADRFLERSCMAQAAKFAEPIQRRSLPLTSLLCLYFAGYTSSGSLTVPAGVESWRQRVRELNLRMPVPVRSEQRQHRA